MNRPYQPPPLSNYARIDTNLLCAAPRGHISAEDNTDNVQDYPDPHPLIENFDLLQDDHDEDSIFTESEDKGENPPVFLMRSPQGAHTKIEIDVNALAEEMSSPFKGRQSQSDDSNLDEVSEADGHLAYKDDLTPSSRPDGTTTLSSRTQFYETVNGKQPSSMDSIPLCESTSKSSMDSEVKFHNGDILSMSSYDSSEKSQSGCEGPCSYKLSTVDRDDHSPTTAIFGLIDNSIKTNDGNIIDSREPESNSPRSASLEMCLTKTQLRGSHGTISEEFVIGAPLHNQSNGNRSYEMSAAQTRTLLIELDQLRQWKINAEKELMARNQDVELLKQCVADYASQVELLQAESTRKGIEQQMTTDTRELERVLERTKSALLAREKTLSRKTRDLNSYKDEVLELRSKLAVCQTVVEDTNHHMASEIIEIAAENEQMYTRIEMLETELKESIEAKTYAINKLGTEVESLRDALAKSHLEMAELMADLDDADSIIRESGDKIASLRVGPTCSGLSADILQCHEQIKLLRIENASIGMKLARAKDQSKEMKTLQIELHDLRTKTSSLIPCNEVETLIKEKDDCIKDLQHRLQSKKLALARYEEDYTSKLQEICHYKSRCKELETITIKLKLNETDLESKVQELTAQEGDLKSQLSVVNGEKTALAKRSIDMAASYEERLKTLQVDAGRASELAVELDHQRCKCEQAQMAMKSLQQALLVSQYNL